MPAIGAVSSNLTVVTKTTAYTANAGELVQASAASAAVTVTLPSAPAVNTLVAVKKTDSSANAVSVAAPASVTVNGASALVLSVAGATVTVQYDGANWVLLNSGGSALANVASGVPAGGAAGQVLAKNSGTDYDASWATGGSGGSSSSDTMFTPFYTSGWWYARRHGTWAMLDYAGNFANLPASTIYYVPMFIHKAVTINAVALPVGSAPTSGSSVRLGAYTAGADGLPSSLLANGDFGLMSMGTTGSVLVTQVLSTNCTLPKGYLWIAMSANSTANVSLIGRNAMGATPTQGLPAGQFNYSNVVSSGAPNSVCYCTQAGSASAAALSSTASPTAVSNSGSMVPDFWFRVA